MVKHFDGMDFDGIRDDLEHPDTPEKYDGEQLMTMFMDVEGIETLQGAEPKAESSTEVKSTVPSRRLQEDDATFSGHSGPALSMDSRKDLGACIPEEEEEEEEEEEQEEEPDMEGDMLDPKKAKRILANRQSAQRSRLRKLQYTSDLEDKVQHLNKQVQDMKPKVELVRTQKQLLTTTNETLRARLQSLKQ
eukprot:gene21817-26253_t